MDKTRLPLYAVRLGAIGLVALALSEVFSPTVYKDSVGKDTIGYGETEGVNKGDRTTPERALAHLLIRVEDDYGDGVKNCVKVPLHQYEYDAYVNLTYNIGVQRFCDSSIVDWLNKEEYGKACGSIILYSMAKGKFIRGLWNRRVREYNMCIGK